VDERRQGSDGTSKASSAATDVTINSSESEYVPKTRRNNQPGMPPARGAATSLTTSAAASPGGPADSSLAAVDFVRKLAAIPAASGGDSSAVDPSEAPVCRDPGIL
jgi:hypothetical protein